MPIEKTRLVENLLCVRERIVAAARRAGRDAEAIRLVAVTKSAEPEDLRALVSLGQMDLGESRIQQLEERAAELRCFPPAAGVRWHMIGHLQRNKVKPCLDAAQVIHSLDSLRLAEEISVRAQREGRVVECLLEVNCSGEPQKSGVAVGAATHLVEQVSTLQGIRLTGLMTMAAQTDDPERARPTFVRLRELFQEMRSERIGGRRLEHLSMGMSQDFEVAIEEGATIVRIGSALFA